MGTFLYRVIKHRKDIRACFEDMIGERFHVLKILPDTVGQPQALVFIDLKRGSGQEYLGGEPLTEQRDLTLFHTSAGRLFSKICYENYLCSKK